MQLPLNIKENKRFHIKVQQGLLLLLQGDIYTIYVDISKTN